MAWQLYLGNPQPHVTHDATGGLTGQGSSSAGSSLRYRAHAASAVLTSQDASLSGYSSSQTTRAATGGLTAQIGTLAGSAARISATITHSATGTLYGQGAELVGEALTPSLREFISISLDMVFIPTSMSVSYSDNELEASHNQQTISVSI